MSKQTFAERCQASEQALPDAPYRAMLTKLHSEMLTALAEQPAQQEPAIWAISYDGKTPYAIWFDGDGVLLDLEVKRQGGTTCKLPLYTSPPAQRTWVGLTDGEWMNIVNKDHAWYGQRPNEVAHEVAKLVEAKLKEKNT